MDDWPQRCLFDTIAKTNFLLALLEALVGFINRLQKRIEGQVMVPRRSSTSLFRLARVSLGGLGFQEVRHVTQHMPSTAVSLVTNASFQPRNSKQQWFNAPSHVAGGARLIHAENQWNHQITLCRVVFENIAHVSHQTTSVRIIQQKSFVSVLRGHLLLAHGTKSIIWVCGEVVDVTKKSPVFQQI